MRAARTTGSGTTAKVRSEVGGRRRSFLPIAAAASILATSTLVNVLVESHARRGIDRVVLVGLQRRRSARQRHHHERVDTGEGVVARRSHRHQGRGRRRPQPRRRIGRQALRVGQQCRRPARQRDHEQVVDAGRRVAPGRGDRHRSRRREWSTAWPWARTGPSTTGATTGSGSSATAPPAASSKPVKVTLPSGAAPTRRRRPVHDRDRSTSTATCTPGETAPWVSSATAGPSNESTPVQVTVLRRDRHRGGRLPHPRHLSGLVYAYRVRTDSASSATAILERGDPGGGEPAQRSQRPPPWPPASTTAWPSAPTTSSMPGATTQTGSSATAPRRTSRIRSSCPCRPA